MSLGLAIVTIAVTVMTGLFVIALFIWGAVKDGEDQEARQARVQRRSSPPERLTRRRHAGRPYQRLADLGLPFEFCDPAFLFLGVLGLLLLPDVRGREKKAASDER